VADLLLPLAADDGPRFGPTDLARFVAVILVRFVATTLARFVATPVPTEAGWLPDGRKAT
jgi:hypothetical protein